MPHDKCERAWHTRTECVSTRPEHGDSRRAAEKAWMLASSAALSMKAGQGVCALLGRSSCGTCAGAGHPDALSEGAIPSLPLELRSLCKAAWHRYASGGAVPLLPHEMRRCELKMCCAWAQRGDLGSRKE